MPSKTKLTPIEALRALAAAPAPYSLYAINHLRRSDKTITQYHVRRALTAAEAKGWCHRGDRYGFYGFSWLITTAGRQALSDISKGEEKNDG